MTKFSTKLKELRKDKDLNQTELAASLSIDRRSISNWENGVREPDYEMLVKIAKFFEVTTDYLLGLED